MSFKIPIFTGATNHAYALTAEGCKYEGHIVPFGGVSKISKCKVSSFSFYPCYHPGGAATT